MAPATALRIAARTCTDVNGADFTGQPVGEDWKTSRTLTTEGTTLTSGYGSNVAAAQSALTVEDLTYGRVLSWNADYTQNGTLATTNTNANYTQLTLTLNRSTSGFALTLNDIDKRVGTQSNDGWTDLVQFDGYATTGSTTPITLSAADVTLGINNSNAWNGNNQVIGTGNNTNTDGNVTVLFPSAVTKVVITYKNAQTTYANPGSQLIGVAGFSWCAQADAYTTLTGPGSLSAGTTSGNYTATFGNNGADNLASQTRVVTVPANTASAVSAPGATVTGSQAAGWTLTYPAATNVASGAANATSYNFTITPLPGTGNIVVTSTTTTTTDQTTTANDQATVSYAVTPIADLTTTLTGPGSLTALPTATLPSGTYTVTYTNNGPSTAASVTRTVTIPTAYVSAVTPSAGGSAVVVGSNFVITFPAGTNVASGNTATYTFTLTPKNSGTSAGQTITATSNTTGTTSQGSNTATDQASVSYIVNNTADIAATFTTPAAATTTATAGTTVNYTVQFTNAGPATAANVTRTVSIPAGVPTVTAVGGTVTGDQTNGWTITYPGGSFAAGNSVSYNFSIVAPAAGPITLTANTTTTSGQTNTGNNTSTRTLNVTPIVLSGTIFDDVNYGGGVGRTYSAANTSATNSGFASGAIGRPTATVELYDASGNYVTSTTSNAAGLYSFNVPSAANYTVRVVNSTVTPARAASATSGIIGVQTYVYNDANRVGGEDPQKLDADANTTSATLASLTAGTGTAATTAQSIKAVTVPAAGLAAVDFGFNFDVITNTRDAGAGSLRQFITNASAIANTNLAQAGQTAGVEASIFMISNGGTTGVPAGLRSGISGGAATNGVATITLASVLPNIASANGASTSLTGLTQSTLYGNQSQPVAETTTGPEVIIDFNGNNGFSISAATPSVISMGFTGANQTGGSTTAAISVVAGATSAVLQNNTFYNNGSNLRINGVGGATITGNVSRDAKATNSDGIEVTSSSNNTITNNQFINNAGFGIDFIGGASTGNTITNNLFKTNGQNTSDGQTAGIGLRSGGAGSNAISNNTFTQNVGDGISSSRGSVGNVFSQNSFFANGDLGIDLTASTTSNNGDGVTINDSGDGDTGSNNLLNFPVLTTVSINTTNLVVSGYARPGAVVELYLAAADPTGFGEGQTYLATRTEGNATDDSNAGTGTYGPANVNGLNQGTDNTNLFTFTIPVSSLTAAQRTALQSGTAFLTSTATISGTGTSEFSGNLAVAVADVTVSITGPTTLNANQATGTYTATFTNEGPATASAVTRTVTLPTGATLSTAQLAAIQAAYAGATYNALTIDFGSVATLAINATSTVSFAFTAPSTVATNLTLTANTSTTSSEGANNAPDAASLTLSTVSTADVTAAIVASSTATTGTFTATFGNNGPQTAAGVAPTVQLPAGLAGVTVSTGWTYTSSTGLVTYNSAPATLNTGSTLVLTINYPLASSPNAPVVAVARITTTTDEAGRTANNSDSDVLATVFDLTTTLSGPASTIAGSPTTLYVTTTNNGPNTALNAAQTVTIPTGLSNLFITNGGTYNSGNGVVTFPQLSNVPSGQTVTNSISFLAPTAAFPVSAAVSSTATESSTTNNTAYLNGAAASTNVAVTTTTTISNEATAITASAAIVATSADVIYTVTATNNGPVTATNVVEKVQLLPGLTTANLKVGGATGTPSGTTITFGTTATYNQTTGVLTYATIGSQTVGATNTFATITVTAPASVGNNGQMLAIASVSTDQKDNVPADNVASVTVKVRTTPDVATAITGPSSTVAGLPTSYVVKFTNSGATDATTVTETAQLPAGLSGVTVTDASGATVSNAYNSSTGLVTFPSITTDATGATQYFTITLTAPGQNFPVSSSIASVTNDGVSTNNSANLNTTVTSNADLAVSITGPATAVDGNPITYLITTSNNGPTTASNAVATVQLPAGLTIQASGPGTSNYNGTTGLLTFANIATIVPGGSALNYVTFTMPSSPANGLISAVASISSATADAIASNNTAGLTTSIAPATTEIADLVTSISLTTPTGTPTSVAAGTTLVYTAAYRNQSGNTATNVVPTANLPAGLSASTLKIGNVLGSQSGTLITFSSGPAAGTTYDVATGLVTFPTIASLAVSATATSYTIEFPAPVGSGQLVLISEIASATSDNVLTNNRSNSSITINTVYDVTTSLVGPLTAPAGATNTYTVTTLNSGPSLTSTTTTQTVTLPSGVTATNISGGGTQSGTTITWVIPVNQPAGLINEVVNSFSVAMPASGNLPLSAAVVSAGETVNTLTNSATLTTTPINIAPIAQNVWNTLRNARGNTANITTANGTSFVGYAISPLNATDVNTGGSIASYTITALPDATQGMLYYNGAAATTAAGLVTDPTKLTFAPATGFVGNATFTYTATDNGGLVSPSALYTIPVAQDQSSTYSIFNNTKGGFNKYATGDVLAQVTDLNTATYNSAGLIYNATTGILQAGAANGLPTTGTNAVLVSGTLPSGVSFDPTTGLIFVSDAASLPRVRTATSYTLTVRTTDSNGGTNTVPVTFTIGAYPLPVELSVFTATARNQDALLAWTTASEKNNDHFDVERSFNGTEFVKIDEVKGQGSSTRPTDYARTDVGVGAKANGLVYFRLKQVDADGTSTYSPVRTVRFGKTVPAIAVFPNPATTTAQLDLTGLPTGTYQVSILDATGRVVLYSTLEAGLTHALLLNNLASGSYTLLVRGNNGGQLVNLTKRLIKE